MTSSHFKFFDILHKKKTSNSIFIISDILWLNLDLTTNQKKSKSKKKKARANGGCLGYRRR